MIKDKHICIRLDDELRRKLSCGSDYDGRSRSNLVVRLLQGYIHDFEQAHGPIDVGPKP